RGSTSGVEPRGAQPEAVRRDTKIRARHLMAGLARDSANRARARPSVAQKTEARRIAGLPRTLIRQARSGDAVQARPSTPGWVVETVKRGFKRTRFRAQTLAHGSLEKEASRSEKQAKGNKSSG